VTSIEVLSGGGEMGAAMRAVDWSRTPLGPVESWPQALKTSVRIMLTSRQPMFVWWGDDLVNLYNDAYRDILGGKHPWALGQPAADVWREIWDQVGPRARSAMQGNEGTYDEALLLIMERNGYPEETYYTFSYSPVPNDSGETGGILCANTNDTQRIIGERQLALLRVLATETADARTVESACRLAAEALETNLLDLPFALIYLVDRARSVASLAARSNIPAGHPLAPDVIELNDQPDWDLAAVARGNSPYVIAALPTPLGNLPRPTWDRLPNKVAIFPIPASGESGQTGILIAGLNPYRLFDADYERFLGLVSGQLAAALANAQAYQEERKRADALAELDRAKTAFFSNVSHEFRTPLTLLLGPLEDSLAQVSDDGDQRERLEVAHRNALRLLRLVNTLLDFSRIEAGRVHASYEATDLPAYTADLASTFRSAIERAGLRLTVDCPPLPDGLDVYVDRDMWEKIVLNLLSNAFKFTFEGQITVRVRPVRDTNSVELDVADTGTGIPPDELPRLFERFHRVQGARARTHEGTGIGLALVQELVRLHGGSVAVDSTPGSGTTFSITLPAGRDHLPADRIRSPRTLQSTGAGAAPFVEEALRWLPDDQVTFDSFASASMSSPTIGATLESRGRILLADDNADMRDYVRRLLTRHYDVDAVANGEAALTAAQANPPDLILSDVMMPAMDGFALLRALRDDEQLREVPVILLSARAGEEARVEGLDAGADDYLSKPFSARELLARVGTHLALSRMRRDLMHREFEARSAAEQKRQELEIEIAERTRAQFLLAGERAVLESIARGQSLAESLETLARVIEAGCDGALCSILLVEPGSGGTPARLRPGTGPSLPDAYNLALDGISVGPAVGSCGTAAHRGEVVVVRDIATDPLWDDFRDLALSHDLRACWSTPILGSDGQILGTFALYHREPSEPTESERELVGVLTYLASIAIERDRGERERSEILERERAARAAAESAVRARDEFMSIASHELRTPVTVVKGIAQMLSMAARRGTLDEQRITRNVETLQRASDRLTILISDLLDVSRLQSGHLVVRPEPVDLGALLREVISRHAESMGSAHVIRSELPNAPRIVSADPTRLEQIFDNLLSNAVKYSPDGGTIDVRLDGDDGVSIAIRDAGIGLPSGDVERIFQPFGRAQNAVDQSLPGMGLGLFISRQIAELHGGRLWAESKGEGQGTTFRLYLPVPAPPTIAQPTPGGEAASV